MIRKEHEGIHWLEFEQLQDHSKVKHALFLRHGGVSQEPCFSLNACTLPEDDSKNAKENVRRMMQFFPGAHLVFAREVHGVNIKHVVDKTPLLEDCDGLITKQSQMALMITHADCQAAIFYDPVEQILANIHCGWRGNVQNIYQHTVESFKKFGSKPSNLLVCISPSLGPNRSEFVNFQTEFPSHFLEFRISDFHFNLWDLSRDQLKKAGVLSSHIEVAEICTYENSQDYFSYRREKKTGRHAAFAMLC